MCYRGVNRNFVPVNNNPFDIGDIIYVSDEKDGKNKETLGVIVSFKKDIDQDLQINYIPNRNIGKGLYCFHEAGSRVFFKNSDRLDGVIVKNVPSMQIDTASEKTSHKIFVKLFKNKIIH